MPAVTTQGPTRQGSGRRGRGNRVHPAFKARRRTELGLLVAASVIIVAAYTLMIYGNTARKPTDLVPLLVAMLLLGAVAHIANRILAPNAHPVILPIAFLLNGLGYVMILRIDLANNSARHPWNFAPLQAAWTAGGVAAYVITLLVIRRSRDLDRYRYLLLAAGVALLLLPLVPHVGENINGARLWVHAGAFSFQPVELAKIVLCIFFASYFAEKRELLTIPTARLGNRLVIDPRPLVPILLAWGFAIGVMSLEHDIGFSAMLFALFIGLLWVTTGRTGYLVLGVILFAIGAYLAGRYLSQTHIRVETWLDPWKILPHDPGDQLRQAWYALGTGGIGGSGLGLGFGAYQIPNPNTDFIFAVIGNEMGLFGSTMVVVAFLLLVGAGLRIAQAARSEFAKLTAVGLTLILGFQAFFIIGGVVRILPLTGITLPFVSYGGSALVANYVLIALLMRISDEGGAAVDTADQAEYEESEERRQRLLTGA
ncbi:MAG TPA: FtsW/RodA/SpoVE family cell cycle protein [Acidimicrobiales bacterium]|nr:FtsW/RodA/SpoVE family cell cycle protein [Acidimicrobiales bacterium]